jgi:23S rRNA pseudouridine2604 synthase
MGNFIRDMGNGVPILDTVTSKCFVEQTGDREFRIILTQGLNRQIRRMCEHFGYRVGRLKRVRIMNIFLDMPEGTWRDFSKSELAEMRMLIGDSFKTS